MTSRSRNILWATILVLLAVTFGSMVHWPIVENNLRYLRSDREAIHFNHIVEVTRRGAVEVAHPAAAGIAVLSRVPSVIASKEVASLRGEMSSLSEFQTRDPFGPRGFSTSVSHPTVLLGSRLFSLAATFGVVLLVFAISLQLKQGPGYAFVGSLVVLLSPEVLKVSYAVTPDIVTIGLCLLTSSLGLTAITRQSSTYIIASALLSGLCAGSQHSTASVALVPLIAWMVGTRSSVTLLAGVVACGFGFCAATPSLVSGDLGLLKLVLVNFLGDWLNPMDAGFGGAVTERSTVYFGWLLIEAIGIASGGLAVASFVYFVKCFDARIGCFLSFPLSYLILLVLHRHTALHELVTIVPYIGVMTACGLQRFAQVSEHPSVKGAALPAFCSLIALQLGGMSYLFLQTQRVLDPRDRASRWLVTETHPRSDIAIDAALHMRAPSELAGVSVVDLSNVTVARLVQDGYTYLVMASRTALTGESTFAEEIHRFRGGALGGDSSTTPEVVVYRLRDEDLAPVAKRAPVALVLRPSETSPSCVSEHEQYCWITARHTEVRVEGPAERRRRARMKIRNPWEAQTVVISSIFGTQLARVVLPRAEDWTELNFEIPKKADAFVLTVSNVHGSQRAGLKPELGRVGLAIKNISVSEVVDEKENSFVEGYPETIQTAIREVFTSHEREVTEEASRKAEEARMEVALKRTDDRAATMESPQEQRSTMLRSRAQQARKTFIDSILSAADDEESAASP